MRIYSLNQNTYKPNFGRVSENSKKLLSDRIDHSAISEEKKREALGIVEKFIREADKIPNIDILTCGTGSSPDYIRPVKQGGKSIDYSNKQLRNINHELENSRMIDFAYGQEGQLVVEVFDSEKYDSTTGRKKCLMDAQEYFKNLLDLFNGYKEALGKPDTDD